MKSKNLPYLSVIFMAIITLSITSCKKDKEVTDVPAITLAQIHIPVLLYKTDKTANFKVNIKSFGGGTVISQGLCVATYHLPTIDNETFPVNTDKTVYNRFVNNLIPDKIYYIRAWIENEAGIAYSEEIEFRTRKFQNSYFGAKINGGDYAINSNLVFTIHEENLLLYSFLFEDDIHKAVFAVLPLEQPNEGTYLFEGNIESILNSGLSCGFYTHPNEETTITSYNITNGAMTITNEIDFDGQHYSMGTFSFTATHEQEVVEITDGAFKVYY